MRRVGDRQGHVASAAVGGVGRGHVQGHARPSELVLGVVVQIVGIKIRALEEWSPLGESEVVVARQQPRLGHPQHQALGPLLLLGKPALLARGEGGPFCGLSLGLFGGLRVGLEQCQLLRELRLRQLLLLVHEGPVVLGVVLCVVLITLQVLPGPRGHREVEGARPFGEAQRAQDHLLLHRRHVHFVHLCEHVACADFVVGRQSPWRHRVDDQSARHEADPERAHPLAQRAHPFLLGDVHVVLESLARLPPGAPLRSSPRPRPLALLRLLFLLLEFEALLAELGLVLPLGLPLLLGGPLQRLLLRPLRLTQLGPPPLQLLRLLGGFLRLMGLASLVRRVQGRAVLPPRWRVEAGEHAGLLGGEHSHVEEAPERKPLGDLPPLTPRELLLRPAAPRGRGEAVAELVLLEAHQGHHEAHKAGLARGRGRGPRRGLPRRGLQAALNRVLEVEVGDAHPHSRHQHIPRLRPAVSRRSGDGARDPRHGRQEARIEEVHVDGPERLAGPRPNLAPKVRGRRELGRERRPAALAAKSQVLDPPELFLELHDAELVVLGGRPRRRRRVLLVGAEQRQGLLLLLREALQLGGLGEGGGEVGLQLPLGAHKLLDHLAKLRGRSRRQGERLRPPHRPRGAPPRRREEAGPTRQRARGWEPE
mmetsp:Transcript_13739/g.32542  ORF Transcript_13739/g.32542 Transcript_13739/m.32542 type:complete len:650 (+) Transcript_13739:695-2644(+)